MSTPNAWQQGAFQTDAFQIDAGDSGVTVALTGQEAASAIGDLAPSIGTVTEAPTPAGGGSSRRRRKPWIVTVDGKDWVVDTLAEAHALYQQLAPAPQPAKKAKPVRRVSVEIRLEDSPPIELRWDGKPLAQVIVERAPDEGAIRAAAEAWVRALEEDDEEVLLLL
jgi:hypothetical protein